MKNRHFLTVFLLTVVFVVQTTESKAGTLKSLPEALNMLIPESKNSFSNLISDQIYKGDKDKYYSKLEINGFEESYFMKSGSNLNFISNSDICNSHDEAVAKVKAYITELSTAFPNLMFKAGINQFSDLEEYSFIDRKENSEIYYEISFKLQEKDNNSYCVTLTVPAKLKIVEYFSIKNEPENSAFASDLRKLIKEGESGFKNIKGEKMDDNGVFYATSFCMYGAGYCFLRNNIFAYIYKAYFATLQQKEDIKNTFNQVAGAVGMALGRDYKYSWNETQTAVMFTLGSMVNVESNSVVSVLYEPDENEADKYNLSIVVSEPRTHF